MNNEQRSILEFQVARSQEAQRNKSLLENYFEKRQETVYQAFRNVQTDQERLVLQIRLNEMDELRDEIESVINSGRMASQSLEGR